MSYVIVGGVCLVLGACIGIFIFALVSLNNNMESMQQLESEFCMGTYGSKANRTVSEEEKDAGR